MSTYTVHGDYIASPSVSIDDPQGTYGLVSARLAELASQGNSVLELLIGDDSPTSTGGLLGAMETAIASRPTPSITAQDVDTSVALDETGLSLPTFTGTLVTVPTVDVDFTGIDLPADITVGLTWAEASLPSDVFTALKTQILADLIDGSTGITATVEDAIYTRARNRQQAENLAQYNRVVNTIGNMHHSLPSGVSAALLADFGMAQMRQEADLEASIVENQAKLAQENRRAAIQGAINLDQLIRQTRDGESNRALDSAKALLDGTLKEYTEKIEAFKAIWDGKKAEVQAKAENVRAAVETNTGLINIYKAQVDAFGSAEDAIAKKNDSTIKALEQAIANAKNDLEAQIAEANALVASYGSEMSIRERIAEGRAQIASHCAIGLLSAANVSANVGYSGSESSSKSIQIGAHISETHSAEHNPAT